jgi:hypothetical protein
MSIADIMIEHCQQQRASLERLIGILQAGTMKTGENHGGGWVDTTAQSLETNKKLLADIKRIEADAKAVKTGWSDQPGTGISDTSTSAPPKP